MAIRQIIEIDEELCNGCGECIPSCAEGALAIVDGKAKVIQDRFCDGLGACLGHCPMDALKIVEREAPDFDEEAAMEHVAKMQEEAPKPSGGCPGSAMASFAKPAGGCPGSAMQSMQPAGLTSAPVPGGSDTAQNELGHWPLQIKLIPPTAPFLKGADLVVAADCTAVAYANFHSDFVAGKAVMMGCPKFDGDYTAYFAQLFRESGVKSVTVLRMEVPCCTGLAAAVQAGHAASGSNVPVRNIIIGRQGSAHEE